MKLAFFSNFLNHHQLPMCETFIKHEDVEFVFVATEPISNDRLSMGYEDMNRCPFVLRAYDSPESEQLAHTIAKEYDVVIFGAAPIEFLHERMALNKLTFKFCERPFKKGTWRRFIPKTRKKIYNGYVRYRNDNLYVLGASAYTSYDLSLCGFNPDKCFKWGYFPKVEERDTDALMEIKNQNERVEILYAGRLLKLKRVMDTLRAVHSLVKNGIQNIHFTVIGDGEEKEKLLNCAKKNKLDNYVTFLPFMSPDEVREYMDRANVYVFSSNYYEGWGAVVNEAMNSACAMLVSHAVGSSKYLIKQDENGVIYRCADVKDLTDKLKRLVSDESYRKRLGKNAYDTVSHTWTAEVATERFLRLCDKALNNEKMEAYSNGPCSKAEIIKNDWINQI